MVPAGPSLTPGTHPEVRSPVVRPGCPARRAQLILDRWWAGSPTAHLPRRCQPLGLGQGSWGERQPLYSEQPLEGAPTTCNALGRRQLGFLTRPAPFPAGISPCLLGQRWVMAVESVDSVVAWHVVGAR